MFYHSIEGLFPTHSAGLLEPFWEIGLPTQKSKWNKVALPETNMEADNGPLEDYVPLLRDLRGGCPLP